METNVPICYCPNEHLIVREALITILNGLREGKVFAQCARCGAIHEVVIGNCFVVKEKHFID